MKENPHLSKIHFIAWKRSWSGKNILLSVGAGLVFARFLIPMEYLAPFQAVTWIGFGIEGLLVLLEIAILVSLCAYLPDIIRYVKASPLPAVFSFPKATDEKMKNRPIVRIICAEMLMFYYVFVSWGKRERGGERTFTLHRESSFIPLQVMLIHAVIIETIGIHWWLHNQSLALSIILLIVNIYTVVLFVGDLQAVRLNPLQVTDGRMYISFGLMKRMEIKWTDIEELIENPAILKQKASKSTIEFIARDFEAVYPDIILKLKYPSEATLLMGIKKRYDQVAIKVDDPDRFKKIVKEKMGIQ